VKLNQSCSSPQKHESTKIPNISCDIWCIGDFVARSIYIRVFKFNGDLFPSSIPAQPVVRNGITVVPTNSPSAILFVPSIKKKERFRRKKRPLNQHNGGHMTDPPTIQVIGTCYAAFVSFGVSSSSFFRARRIFLISTT
jgi:hypothetical protein